MKRSGRISPTSKKRAKEIRARRPIREAVFDRDGRLCLLHPSRALNREGRDWGPCFGIPLTPHHLKKAGQGGKFTLENLVTLCAGHNDMVEDWPDAAAAIGLVIREEADDNDRDTADDR